MNTTIAQRYLPALATNRAYQALLVIAGVVLLTLSAKLQVPFWPVPMTMQTFAVLMIGATCGARLGGATLLAYLATGAVGLPVFASGAGPAYMMGPTGGYLLGFLAAAMITGALADRGYGRTIVSAVLMLLAGLAAIYILGAGWLAVLFGIDKAIAAGVIPFLPAEALKLALAVVVMTAASKAPR
ncbi:biotin transporter BioY [soil metagenome]